MKQINLFKLVIASIVFFAACETTEDEPGVNNPEELVGNWQQTDIEAGMEITVSSGQTVLDPVSPGNGSGITITGSGINETLNYLSPFFMFMNDDCEGMDCGEDEPKLLFAAQNLGWDVLFDPAEAIGQTLKIFLIMDDHDDDYYHDGTMVDSIITRAVYFEMVIQDSNDFFFEDRPPDVFYMADEVTDFTFDTTTFQLNLNNLTLIYGDVDSTDSSDWDIIWDSTRSIIASGDLAPDTYNISANTPTAVEFPFWDDKDMGGAPVSIELFDDGTMDMVEVYWDCDFNDNCEWVTENISGEWWTEGLDTLILELPAYEDEPIDTVELIYIVSGNNLTVVHRENPCDYEDEYYSKEECMTDFENGLFGLESGTLSDLEIITKVEFTKSAAAARLANKAVMRNIQESMKFKKYLENLKKYLK